jgi:hypothetical protein
LTDAKIQNLKKNIRIETSQEEGDYRELTGLEGESTMDSERLETKEPMEEQEKDDQEEKGEEGGHGDDGDASGSDDEEEDEEEIEGGQSGASALSGSARAFDLPPEGEEPNPEADLVASKLLGFLIKAFIDKVQHIKLVLIYAFNYYYLMLV